MKLQIQTQEIRFKQEKDKFALEREELNKNITRLLSKETQFKHEIKQRDLINEKLKDQVKLKLFDKATK